MLDRQRFNGRGWFYWDALALGALMSTRWSKTSGTISRLTGAKSCKLRWKPRAFITDWMLRGHHSGVSGRTFHVLANACLY